MKIAFRKKADISFKNYMLLKRYIARYINMYKDHLGKYIYIFFLSRMEPWAIRSENIYNR